tara:strand:- start:585 stop:1571 length:987 start_codon:yes stop_codon:yes gene_type:complete
MIKNIAVCLYGRFGTGEYCAPSILKFFKTTHNVNVDFFCATKDYNNYYHTKYNRSRHDITMIDTEYLTDMLAVYNPKDMIIVNYETDLGRRCGNSNTGPMFSQLCESVMLKSNYEAINDMQYDVVFVTRYDILFHPKLSNYLDHYITWHNKEFINKQYDIFGNFGDSWMFTPREDQNFHNSYAIKESWHDLFLFGSSMTMDLVASNSLLLTNDQQYNTNKKTHIYADTNMRNGHEGLGYIFRKSNISVATYPFFDMDGNATRLGYENYGEWYLNKDVPHDQRGYTLVREFGDMITPSTSIEAYHNNRWTWKNDLPFAQMPPYNKDTIT